MLQSDSIKKLHDDERLTVLLPDFMDGADVGMIQRGSSPSFALEAGARLWVFRHFIGQELQGNEAVQVYIFGLTDNPPPPATKPFDDAVMRYGLADHSRESCLGKTGKSTNAERLARLAVSLVPPKTEI